MVQMEISLKTFEGKEEREKIYIYIKEKKRNPER